ncbi:MAG: ABC transporter substrate-binding protein [Actinobacteria bacterium]|nr:ABC transporter substrate-binding protein [Actinomycetota bacterium]
MVQARKSRLAAALSLLAVALCLWAASTAAAAAPKRIVALTPFAANTLAKLGVEPVAIGQTVGGNERFAPQLNGVTVLPLSHPNGPNLEQLVSLRPDLVLSTKTWAKGNQAMQSLGIRVVTREPVRVNGVIPKTLAIGSLVGKLPEAKKLVAKMKEELGKARKGIAKRPTVMVILGVGHSPFTFLPNSWGGDLVRKAGAEVLAGGLSSGSGFQRISDEVVVAENPEILIVVPHGEPKDVPAITRYFENDPAWGATRAAKEGHIYISTNNSLLQAGTDAAKTIEEVRRRYLHNWPG